MDRLYRFNEIKRLKNLYLIVLISHSKIMLLQHKNNSIGFKLKRI